MSFPAVFAVPSISSPKYFSFKRFPTELYFTQLKIPLQLILFLNIFFLLCFLFLKIISLQIVYLVTSIPCKLSPPPDFFLLIHISELSDSFYLHDISLPSMQQFQFYCCIVFTLKCIFSAMYVFCRYRLFTITGILFFGDYIYYSYNTFKLYFLIHL